MDIKTQKEDHHVRNDQDINRQEVCLKILEINKVIIEMNVLIFKELSTPSFFVETQQVTMN